jgi:hypothetical protein
MGPRQGFANMAGSIVSNAASALIVGGFVMSYLIEQWLYAGGYSGARWVRCRIPDPLSAERHTFGRVSS